MKKNNNVIKKMKKIKIKKLKRIIKNNNIISR